jgi:hypothetical protein
MSRELLLRLRLELELRLSFRLGLDRDLGRRLLAGVLALVARLFDFDGALARPVLVAHSPSSNRSP